MTYYSRGYTVLKGTGVVTNDLKLKLYPAIIGILGVCLLASLLFNVEIQVDRGTPPENPAATPTQSPLDVGAPPVDTSTPPPAVAPAAPSSPSPLPALTAPDPQTASPPASNVKGGLRVSNQTDYPLRLALLEHQNTSSSTTKQPGFGQPVHWDFAPQEGRAKGLLLSLPNSSLELQSGDVLMAFALDGSRRYWGPYVVGQTPLPVWNDKEKQWQLILNP